MNEEEPVVFENWEADGCHVFVEGKYVLTLNTPESTAPENSPTPVFLEDWVSPEEFCEALEKVLRAFGASEAVIAEVENEREHYRNRPVKVPLRKIEELLST